MLPHAKPIPDAPLKVELGDTGWLWSFAIKGTQWVNGPFDSDTQAREDYVRFSKESGRVAPMPKGGN